MVLTELLDTKSMRRAFASRGSALAHPPTRVPVTLLAPPPPPLPTPPPQVSLENEGTYYCQVSNKDGSINSSKATLTVTRAARLHRATGVVDGAEVRRVRRVGRHACACSRHRARVAGLAPACRVAEMCS